MPTAFSGNGRIATNIPAENSYNALTRANNRISAMQLQLSTGKRINQAADDVAGYITSKSLKSRNSTLRTSLNAVSEAINVTSIVQDALDNIGGLLTNIKESTATASSGALGTDEKIALAKSAYRLAQQIQFIADSTVFGGQQLLYGNYSGAWNVGMNANNNMLTLGIDLSASNPDFGISNGNAFSVSPSTTISPEQTITIQSAPADPAPPPSGPAITPVNYYFIRKTGSNFIVYASTVNIDSTMQQPSLATVEAQTRKQFGLKKGVKLNFYGTMDNPTGSAPDPATDIKAWIASQYTIKNINKRTITYDKASFSVPQDPIASPPPPPPPPIQTESIPTDVYFGGVNGLDLNDLNNVNSTDLGVFSQQNISSTLHSLAMALTNITKVNSYVGGIQNRLTSQTSILQTQITNYNSAISRIEDTDVAQSQLELVKSQFLQQASLISLAQANQNPNTFLYLLK